MKKIQQFVKGKLTLAYKMHCKNELHEQKSKKSEFSYFKDCIFSSLSPVRARETVIKRRKEKKKAAAKDNA